MKGEGDGGSVLCERKVNKMPQFVATQKGAGGNEVKGVWVSKSLWMGRVWFHILHKKVQVLKLDSTLKAEENGSLSEK